MYQLGYTLDVESGIQGRKQRKGTDGRGRRKRSGEIGAGGRGEARSEEGGEEGRVVRCEGERDVKSLENLRCGRLEEEGERRERGLTSWVDNALLVKSCVQALKHFSTSDE